MISKFTRVIYTIGIAASSCRGDGAPLVGHNAFLRWASVKKVAFWDEEQKRTKYWSEDHVSEGEHCSAALLASRLPAHAQSGGRVNAVQAWAATGGAAVGYSRQC
jgi:hypothetical protein